MKLYQSTIKTALAGIVVSKAQKQPLTHTTQKTLKKSLATIAKADYEVIAEVIARNYERLKAIKTTKRLHKSREF